MRTSKAGPVKHLILGIDPGTTTGIALLDLSSRIVLLKSARVLSKSDIVSIASSYGKVVLVATDRVHSPKLVNDVARALGAKLFRQDLEFSYRDKLKTVTDFLSTTKEVPADEHQISALFGALKAFKAHKNQLEEAVKELDSLEVRDRGSLEEQLKARVIQGLSISRALKSILPTSSTPKMAVMHPEKYSRGSSVLREKPQRPATSNPKVSGAAKNRRGPHIIRHPKTVVIPSRNRQMTEGKADISFKEPVAPALKPSGATISLPKGLRIVKVVGVLTRRRIKEMVGSGALLRSDIVYGSRISDDPEKVGMELRKAGVSVAILEELDDSSILQMMNENVVPITTSQVPVVQLGTDLVVEEAGVLGAIKHTESRYRDMLLTLLSGL
ncbi:MAG: DUF460 domain-containing protein [Candidatus Bathyarchaeia archaeon]